jgi:hypothetical protein
MLISFPIYFQVNAPGVIQELALLDGYEASQMI